MALSAEVFESNRNLLWGLCYRMTGNAADADDLVQETFVRAMESPPRRMDEPLRPWLVRVAMNLSRDHLRRRRRREYVGPWLPSPVPTDDLESPASYEPVAGPEDSPVARYDMLESISFAFLLALEALTPAQRAVLLLRDVFDYSTEETAQALSMSEANVKVLLHRARRRMRDYDKGRATPDAARRAATRRALEQFLLHLSSRNAEGLERLLTEDAVSIADGGGEVAAARFPIRGRDKVMRLMLGLAEKIGVLPRVTFRMLNGWPALVVEMDHSMPGIATRFTIHCEVDDAGRIRRLNQVVAPSKLSAL
ncbi:MAG TPA: sigma-70 family RNA polymerase sigma factor [Blastocatellia bacterium]|nr:sigma-70 family RNA polymerase sigma factor [Blastocatellia bacterium]